MKTFFYIIILVTFYTCEDNPSTPNNDDNIAQNYFIIEIEETGESTLFIFQETISNIENNDEIGLFDANGIIDNQGNSGMILVGSGIWNGTQAEIVAIMGVDLSSLGGPTLPGSTSGNDLVLKIWDQSEEMLYETTYVVENGSGTFNGLFTAISEINLE